MRPPTRFRSHPASARLALRRDSGRTELWTETVGALPSVYGERWIERDGRTFRAFDPNRSKLSAAVVHGWSGELPSPGQRWLYLGAASGTTASHVADLVGPHGRVYAVERSVRPFARLLELSARWPNLLPILADAREPRNYSDLVPPVDGLYADIAQPDQTEIAYRNAALFLSGAGGLLLIALKTSSIGREVGPAGHLARAETELGSRFALAPSVKLDPFHRAHYLVGGRARDPLFSERGTVSLTKRDGRRRARSAR